MSEKNRKAGTGQVKISESVVSSVAAVAASEVEGVKAVGGKRPANVSRKAPRHVSLSINGNQVTVDISITVKYGFSIPVVGKAVQNAVTAAVEAMTGLSVVAVNVHCLGIAFPKENKDKK
ncbi:MAG TPA: Asp23/Gls24 family envelope stress response protein [Clostridiales bacterium]|jgi:uncharacterized alkaline shock family protein YloU|nr:Asp23/Gls24 family envelope stress response protein [Clostridiales bacterium]